MQEEQTLQQELQTAKRKTAKPMLWVSIISMIMFFAGLTSAYVISMKREDWVSFDLPDAFYTSTIVIVLSSISLIIAKRLIKQNKLGQSLAFTGITLLLGLAFVWFQYVGFNELKSIGLYFTGPESTVSTSFIIGITFMHVLHLLAGIIVLLVLLVKQIQKKYTSNDLLGFELGAIFWHFVDILWIYLFLFFYFIK
ncbi:MAG: cytochrome c oxidase subunit 3 [Polaribacter sp.]|jgi:cytochrome c oxidase subunit 3